ncbi:uncharacterized protein TRIADDRAFT_13868, partial [Trichoplax adhaerens]
VKVCDLPTYLNDQDVASFFRGLNIIRGGISFLLSEYGKRYGQAYVKFEDTVQRDLALKRHSQYIDQKSIRIYKINAGQGFIPNVGGATIVNALMKSNDRPEIALLRIKGLPSTVIAIDVVNFFKGTADVLDNEEGVLLLLSADGRTTGEGYVAFKTPEIARSAIYKDYKIMANHHIELYDCSLNDALKALQESHISSSYRKNDKILTNLRQKSQESVRDCIRLRGLPFTATEPDITNFMGELADKIALNGIHLCINDRGRPSGDAYIQMLSAEDAIKSAEKKHREHLGTRWIEVFQCSREEV